MSTHSPKPIHVPPPCEVTPPARHTRPEAFDEADKAPATLTAYRSDWRAFTNWCDTHQHRHLPAAPDTVEAWLQDQMAAGYAISTIQRRLITIRQQHRHNGHPSPTDTQQVQATWATVRRRLGTAPRKVAPLTLERLRQVIAPCPPTPAGRRDHAMLVIGFAGALRRSEIAGLDLADIEPDPAGLILTIRKSKTDQHRAGQRLGLPYGDAADTCPVRVLAAWTPHLPTTAGPLFRPIDRHGNISDRHLSGRAIAEIIKRRCALAGLDPGRYSGHSLRAGFATSAAAAGATETAIARQTRHRSMDVLRGYIREGDLFRTNAATTIGL